MPASLLDSQIKTLEPPAPDEHVLIIDVAPTPQQIVTEIIGRLNLQEMGANPGARPNVAVAPEED